MSISPFDYFKDISEGKTNLMVDDAAEAAYVPFIVQRVASLFPDTIMDANVANTITDKKMHHDYLFHKVRKRKRFKKWPWKKGQGEQLAMIMDQYKYSPAKARAALRVLTAEQLKTLTELQEQKQGNDTG